LIKDTNESAQSGRLTNEMDTLKRREKAIDFASDTSKLLITLATAFVAFTVTFSEKLGGLVVDPTVGRLLLLAVWAVFTISVGCGVWAQLALTTELEPAPGSPGASREPSIRSRAVKCAFMSQVLTFVFATLLGSLFGVWRIYQPPPSKPVVENKVNMVSTTAQVFPLPAFEPGSSVEPHEQLVSAVCTARHTLQEWDSSFAVVVGRHDRRPLLPQVAREFGSNAALAQQRAERVGQLLQDGNLCNAKDARPVPQLLAIAASSRNTRLSSYTNDAELEAALAEDRRVEIYGFRTQSTSTVEPKHSLAPAHR